MINERKSIQFAFFSVLLWSTVSTAFKIALKDLDFLQLLFVANIVSAIIFSIYTLNNYGIKNTFKQSSKKVFYSAVVGLVNPTLYYLVLFKAYSLLPAQIAQPLNYTWPFVLTILSAITFKNKLNIHTFIAFFFSLIAIFLIATQGNISSLHIKSPLGVFLAVISSVFWAIYWILNMKDYRPEAIKLFWGFLFSSIYITFLMLISGKLFTIKFTNSLIAAVYAGFFELGITFIFWLKALKYAKEPSKISNLIYLSPVLALFFIHFVLGEKIFYTTFVGLAMIVGSILYLKKFGQP